MKSKADWMAHKITEHINRLGNGVWYWSDLYSLAMEIMMYGVLRREVEPVIEEYAKGFGSKILEYWDHYHALYNTESDQ